MAAVKKSSAQAVPPLPQQGSEKGAGQLTPAWLAASVGKFAQDPKNRLAQNVVTRTDVMEAAVSRDAFVSANHHFSVSIREQHGVEGLATSQQASGRCWLFAMLNTLRFPMMKRLGLPHDFELSQNYLFFWDKIERSNFFLETMIETASEPYDGRLVQWLLSQPVSDGGQWDMAVNLITKYGIVPKEVFPESHSATASARMNYILTNKLRQFASELRELWASGADTATLRDAKLGMMEVVHSIVLIHLGTPPAGTFDWSYTDKQSKFHCLRGLTPQRFLAEVVQVNVTTKVSLIHDPRNPFYAKYTVHKLNNMVGGLPVTYINLPIEELQRYAAQTLEAGEPVWFGCDCGKFMQRGEGLFDTEAFDYELVYGIDNGPGMDKRTRLHMGESLMTHAMVFTGYDKRPGEELPSKWRVENSWGRAAANAGYYVMTDKWFNEWMYQIAVDVSILPQAVTAVIEQEATLLDAWDPMGSLARAPDNLPLGGARL